MKRYESYKDSGVKWLGEIPSHWEIMPIKRVANTYAGATPKSGNENYWGGSIAWITPADFKTDTKYVKEGSRNLTELGVKSCSTNLVPEGSVIFSKRAPVGQLSIATQPLCTNQGCISCVPLSGVDSTFLYYLLSVYKDTFESFSSGTTFKELSQQSFNSFRISLPPKLEQIAMVKHLDEVTSKIDTTIAQQQKMIDLLNERKQIIINHAVTKGLNPNAPMKDSGIDWIGQIPSQWDIKRGKFLFRIVNDLSKTGEEELLSVSDKTGVTPRSMKNVNMFMAESLVGYKKCKVGDICSNIMWMWHGAVGVSKYEGVISPSYGVYRQIGRYYHNDYLDLMLRLPRIVKLYSVLSTGLTESRLRLYPSDFLGIYFMVPPIEEQKKIVEYVRNMCNPLDSAIDNIEKQISLLQERKQIIINDVVTGKVKVV